MPLSRKRRLPLVREGDAGGRTLEIYQNIKSVLGIPHVNVLFQAYGAWPQFLEVMWQCLRPALETREFFVQAERLRAEAYTRAHNYFLVPDLCDKVREVNFSPGAQHELTEAVELFHYNNPLLLLIAAMLMQAFEDGPAQQRTAEGGADHPVFTEKLVKITEESASAPIRRIYDDIKRTLGVSFINTDYQAFARWPDFLTMFWATLKPAVLSPLYGESKHAMHESAVGLAAELPNAPHLSVEHMQNAGLGDDEISAAIQITEEFLDLLSGLVLNIAIAKISLEGGNQARIPSGNGKLKSMPRVPERAA
jgi:hypothetical protein